MMRSLFSAVSGLKSNQTSMDIIGNNIANVNTVGYKTSRTIFQDIFSQTISNATAPTANTGGSNAKQVGLGVTISTIGMNMTEGSTQSTSNPLDFAIAGEGFFVVDRGGSYVYTRNGALQLDQNGFLVSSNGDYVMAVAAGTEDSDSNAMPDNLENGADVLDTSTSPATPYFSKIQLLGDVTDSTGAVVDHYSDYAIDSNGIITAVNNTGAKVAIGRVVLSTFNNTTGLEKIGSSYYIESQNSGSAKLAFAGDGTGSLDSGSLEMSNVDLSTELTNMIITQRGFQANSRVITTTDNMLEELINIKR